MIQELDSIFPFIVFFYGAFMTLVTSLPSLRQKAENAMNQELVEWFYGHRVLGLICLFVGGLWSLQRLFITIRLVF